MMLRLILYVVIGYFLWKIIRSVAALLQGPPSPQGKPRQKARKDFSDIQDADFEDITKKKDSEEHPPS